MPLLMLLMTIFTLQSGTQGRWELQRIVPPSAARGLRALTPERLQLSLRPDDDSHMDNSYSADEISARFSGLTAAQLDSGARTATHFGLRAEAGTFICDGYVEAGRGTGTYVFRPDPNFKSQMQSLGYPNISDRQVASLAMLQTTSQYVRDFRAAGVTTPDLDTLIGMWAVGVTVDYLRDMQSVGLRPAATDLIGMWALGVTIDFVRQARQSDPGASINDLIGMRVIGSRYRR